MLKLLSIRGSVQSAPPPLTFVVPVLLVQPRQCRQQITQVEHRKYQMHANTRALMSIFKEEKSREEQERKKKAHEQQAEISPRKRGI